MIFPQLGMKLQWLYVKLKFIAADGPQAINLVSSTFFYSSILFHKVATLPQDLRLQPRRSRILTPERIRTVMYIARWQAKLIFLSSFFLLVHIWKKGVFIFFFFFSAELKNLVIKHWLMLILQHCKRIRSIGSMWFRMS